MNNQDWLNYKIEVRERLRGFMFKIFELMGMFPKYERGKIVNNQVTGSGSGTCANYRAKLPGRFLKEFFERL